MKANKEMKTKCPICDKELPKKAVGGHLLYMHAQLDLVNYILHGTKHKEEEPFFIGK